MYACGSVFARVCARRCVVCMGHMTIMKFISGRKSFLNYEHAKDVMIYEGMIYFCNYSARNWENGFWHEVQVCQISMWVEPQVGWSCVSLITSAAGAIRSSLTAHERAYEWRFAHVLLSNKHELDAVSAHRALCVAQMLLDVLRVTALRQSVKDKQLTMNRFCILGVLLLARVAMEVRVCA